MSSGDVIAIFAIGVPVISLIVGGIITHLISTIRELRVEVKAKDAIIDNKDETIAELKRQNDKMEITGTIMNRFFSQLTNSNLTELKREIQP